MELAEFLIDLGSWFIAMGVFVFAYMALFLLMTWFMGGRK